MILCACGYELKPGTGPCPDCGMVASAAGGVERCACGRGLVRAEGLCVLCAMEAARPPSIETPAAKSAAAPVPVQAHHPGTVAVLCACGRGIVGPGGLCSYCAAERQTTTPRAALTIAPPPPRAADFAHGVSHALLERPAPQRDRYTGPEPTAENAALLREFELAILNKVVKSVRAHANYFEASGFLIDATEFSGRMAVVKINLNGKEMAVKIPLSLHADDEQIATAIREGIARHLVEQILNAMPVEFAAGCLRRV